MAIPPLPTTTAMDDTPPIHLTPTQYRAPLAAPEYTSLLVSPSFSLLPLGSSGLPPPLQTPTWMSTQSPLAYDTELHPVAHAINHKRKFSEREEGFDDVWRIDGGDDQDLRYVPGACLSTRIL